MRNLTLHASRFLSLTVALFALAACVTTPQHEGPSIAIAGQPRFDAVAFFSGHTQGHGRLRILFSRTSNIVVDGHGVVKDGVLHLDQIINEEKKPAKHRTWVISEVSPGHYAGTLTDAKGAVTGEVQGNRLHLSFTMNGGLPTEQWLTLSQDGQHASNVMKVHKLGMTIAILSEYIRREP